MLLPTSAIAQVCSGPFSSEEHKKFNQQKNYKPHEIHGADGRFKFKGLLDVDKNEFHITNKNITSKSIEKIDIQLNYDFEKKRFKRNFAKLCKSNDQKKRELIGFMRTKKTSNSFIVSTNFLPKLNDSEQQFLLDESIQLESFEVSLSYIDLSVHSLYQEYPNKWYLQQKSKEIQQLVDTQSLTQGKLKINMSGMEDTLCDLINKNAQINVKLNYKIKDNTLREHKFMSLEEKTLLELTDQWSKVMQPEQTRDDNMFLAGATYEKLATEKNLMHLPSTVALSMVNFLTKSHLNHIDSSMLMGHHQQCLEEYASSFLPTRQKRVSTVLQLDFNTNEILDGVSDL